LEGLCRLLIGVNVPIIVIDHDRVEPRNLLRQGFYEGDLGKFKAQVIAERCARQFNRRIGYCVQPFDKDLVEREDNSFSTRLVTTSLIIGCVDNATARRSITEAVPHNWWLDAGNGFHSGQVLLGNTLTADGLKQGFRESEMSAHKLPAPSLQLPAILIPAQKEEPRSCAQAVEDNDQSPVINQAMATLILDMVYRLGKGDLDYMAAYLDLMAGTFRRVPVEPVTVARMFSMDKDELMSKDLEFRKRR
jgi:PRTRC genetic system ThiF family protein